MLVLIVEKIRKNGRYSNKDARKKKKKKSSKIYFDICLVYAYLMIFYPHASLRHTEQQ